MKYLIFVAALMSSAPLFLQSFTPAKNTDLAASPYFVMLARRAEILGLTPPTIPSASQPSSDTQISIPSIITPTSDDDDNLPPTTLQIIDTELNAFLEQLNTLTQELSTFSKQRNTL